MRINHNISALRATSLLNKNNSVMSKSLEKLSSGYKINRAADDGAGMAISKRMKSQIKGLEQASQNSADGISVIQTAEGALNEVTSMLQRMRELAVQAANGSNTLEDRMAIQKEVDQLNAEIQRVSNSTEFNTKSLLDGSLNRRTHTDNTKVEVLYTSDTVKAGDYSINVTEVPEKALITGMDLTDVTKVITEAEAGIIKVNGEVVTVNAGDTLAEVYEKIRNTCDAIGIDVFATDGTTDAKTGEYTKSEISDGTKLCFQTKQYGMLEKIELSFGNDDLAAKFGFADKTITETGADCKVTLNDPLASTGTVKTDGKIATITDLNGVEMQLNIENLAGKGTVNFTVLEAGNLTLQIGAANKQTLSINIPRMDSMTLGIDNINICTADSAERAITSIDHAINRVTEVRAKLGAYQNRLEHSVNNVDTSTYNMEEALSRITDTDMAKEMTKYTQNQVLVQAGSSMVAQANELPQTVLSLLQG